MRILLIPLGSAGDVHPFIGLGLALQRRGHQVTLMTSGYFADLIRKAGLELIELGSQDEFIGNLADPDIWHPRKGIRLLAERLILPILRTTYENVTQFHVPGQTLVIASSGAFGARVAQEKWGIPLATIHLQPGMLRSAYQAPVFPGLRIPDWVPCSGKRFVYWLADTAILDRMLVPGINAFRSELGLSPVRRLFHNWVHSPQRVIGLFPAWFAPPQPDWPSQLRLTGFPLYDERGIDPLPSEVEEFLAAGDPPIVFTPGSAMRYGQDFFAAAAEACQLLGRRGILLTRFVEQIPAALPEGVRHFSYIPFSQVLPQAAAFVHHGGIGSSAQGLAAGIPQFIMPLAYDQFDNAARLQRLGVARSLRQSRFRAPAVAQLLRELLDSTETAHNCRHVKQFFLQGNPLEDTCQTIEEMQVHPECSLEMKSR